MGERTVSDLLATALTALGVRRVFGVGGFGLPVVPVGEAGVADLLADVDGRIGRLGASFDGRILRLSPGPGSSRWW
jgi:hypothetical protein